MRQLSCHRGALSKARVKLKFEAFRELNEKLNHFFDEHSMLLTPTT